MICPKCNKINQCPCTNCDPDGIKPNKYIRVSEDLVKCSFCESIFHAGDSLNYEWDNMIKEICEKISPDMCIEWFETGRRDSKLDYELAFKEYFNRSPVSISGDDWLRIKREYKLSKII